MDFYPWQPFDSCWEPDEGMLPELERDGMVAWARRELFHADVEALLISDRIGLRELETTERARAYGYGPLRPLYLPEGINLDGEAWVVSTLPELVREAAASGGDLQVLQHFERTIGRDAEIICRSYGGKTAHKVAHRLCNPDHPLNGPLLNALTNDLGVWLSQEPEVAARTPIGRLLDRGVMRAIGERMRRIRSGMSLNPERPIPLEGGMPRPLIPEGPMEAAMRIALWGNNGLGFLLRSSMVEFLRERLFDLGSHWLFVSPDAGYKRAGLGYALIDSFWEIVKVIDLACFEPDRQDCWQWSFEPYGRSGSGQALLTFRPSRTDWGLLESWVHQHRYSIVSGNWGEIDLPRLYRILAAELSYSHNVLGPALEIGADPVTWWDGKWKQWGVEHTNPLTFDHEQRYRPMGASKAHSEWQEGSWLKSQWVMPMLYGLMERLAQAYGERGLQAEGHLASSPPAWSDLVLKDLLQPSSSSDRREAIAKAMPVYSTHPELVQRGLALPKNTAGPSIVPVLELLGRLPISGWAKAELRLPAGDQKERAPLLREAAAGYDDACDEAIRQIKTACAAAEIWTAASEVAGLDPIAMPTLKEALASDLDINHPGYAKDLRAVLLERLTEVEGVCYRPRTEELVLHVRARLC